MKIVLKDNQLSKEQEQHTEELVNKYKDYLNVIDNWIFEKRGVHLLRPQLAYVALSVEKTWFMNRDESKEDLLTLMCVAGVKAICEMLCIEMPDEIEIDKNFKVVGLNDACTRK